MVEDAELIEDENIIIEGSSEGRAEEYKIRLSKNNIAWKCRPYNDVYNWKGKKFKFPLNEINLDLIRGERGIIVNSSARLTIIKKNNTTDKRDWNIWTVFFDYKQNQALTDFLQLFKARKKEKIELDHYERNKKIAHGFEKRKNYEAAIKIWKELDKEDETIRVLNTQAEELISEGKYSLAINLWKNIDNEKEAERFTRISAKKLENEKNYDGAMELWNGIKVKEETIRVMKLKAGEREKARDYEAAIEIWEALGEIDEAARARKMKAEMGSVKVAQKIVHGDDVTEIKDSVLNRSNVGTNSEDKFAKLERLTEMKKEGLISDEEYDKMKQEIIG